MSCTLLFYRKALTVLRRGPLWKMTAASLQCESGPAVEPGGPYWPAVSNFLRCDNALM